MSNPNCLTKLIVNCPCCVLPVAVVIMILVSLVVFSQGWLLPNDQNSRDFYVWGSDVINDYDKSVLIKEYLSTQSEEDITPL